MRALYQTFVLTPATKIEVDRSDCWNSREKFRPQTILYQVAAWRLNTEETVKKNKDSAIAAIHLRKTVWNEVLINKANLTESETTPANVLCNKGLTGVQMNWHHSAGGLPIVQFLFPSRYSNYCTQAHQYFNTEQKPLYFDSDNKQRLCDTSISCSV
jgi:hypothetical protein